MRKKDERAEDAGPQVREGQEDCMTEPTVCAVMLTRDRPALARRAVECFRAQTYERKCLVIYDSGEDPLGSPSGAHIYCRGERDGKTVGALRNEAASWAISWSVEGIWTGIHPDIICHWDDDDWSQPNRIAEQVALMEATGADVVGYTEMLFWREPPCLCAEITQSCPRHENDDSGEAWLYTGSILGTSLMYRRSVWQRFPFPDTSYGEDTDWLKQVAHAKVKIVVDSTMNLMRGADPRMIARIHAGNTSKAYEPKAMQDAPHHWSRVPEWDQHCREVME
jgi:glycosyltransferase involved in cell wall biosynthesis